MEYRNAKYINANGWVDCEINHPKHGWIPYTLDPNDTDMTVDNNELMAAMKENNDVAEYVPPSQEDLDAAAASSVRAHRDAILKNDVDPVVSNPLRWSDMSGAEQQAWADYRQALLDITLQDGFPHNVIWPTKP